MPEYRSDSEESDYEAEQERMDRLRGKGRSSRLEALRQQKAALARQQWEGEMNENIGDAAAFNLHILKQRRSNVPDKLWPTLLATYGAEALVPDVLNYQQSTIQAPTARSSKLVASAKDKKRKRKINFCCEVCGEKEMKENEIIECHDCGRGFHPECIDMPQSTIDVVIERQDWRCVDCKVCEVCHQTGLEDKMLFCDVCDLAYHTFCCDPPLKSAPAGGWRCPKCVKCISCGTTRSKKWQHNYTVCDRCYELHSRGQYCPVCKKVYSEEDESPMIGCDDCEKWVHKNCEHLTDEQYQVMGEGDIKYRCPECKPGVPMAERAKIKRNGKWVQFLDTSKGTCIGTRERSPSPTLADMINGPPKVQCCFCRGKESTTMCGNLVGPVGRLYFHEHCAYYAKGVELSPDDGSFTNIDKANTHAQEINCAKCKRPGGSIECEYSRCRLTYHYECAVNMGCVFTSINNTRYMFCSGHPPDHIITTIKQHAANAAKKRKQAEDERRKAAAASASAGAAPTAALAVVGEPTGPQLPPVPIQPCIFCEEIGVDQAVTGPLLGPISKMEVFFHENCGLYAPEIFFDGDHWGNVEKAIKRGKLTKCSYCKKFGGIIGCQDKKCNKTYHYTCGHAKGAKFSDDMLSFCKEHIPSSK